MSPSSRHNSHASRACVNCRQRKRKCSGSGPTCAACAEKSIQCEWSVESDGRTLRLENASLRAEVAELRALVEELSYYAVDGVHAASALQIDAHHEHGGPDVSFNVALDVRLPGSNIDAGALCPTLEGQASAAAVECNTEAAGVQVNVFGTGAPPLYTGHALPDGRHVQSRV